MGGLAPARAGGGAQAGGRAGGRLPSSVIGVVSSRKPKKNMKYPTSRRNHVRTVLAFCAACERQAVPAECHNAAKVVHGRVGGMLVCRFARLRPLTVGGAGSGRCGEVATLGRCREVCDALHAACTSNMASAESVPSESMLRSSPACKAEPRHAIASPCVGTAHKAQPLQCTSLELPS